MPEPAPSAAFRAPAWAGTLEGLPPAVRYRLAGVLAALPAVGAPFEGVIRDRFARLLDDGEPWLGGEPALAELGAWLVDPRQAAETRRHGCTFLALFPSVTTVKQLAAIALDAATPPAVREQAIAALGDRQVRDRHPRTLWPSDAVAIADEALVRLATDAADAGKITSEQLPLALRHVTADGIAAVFARAPGLWGDAIECFASPPLARVLAVSIDDVPPQHRLRVLRLVAATLGAEAVPVLLARVPRAAIGEQLEMLCLAIAFGGEAHLGKLEDAVRGMKHVDMLRARVKWHLRNPGVVPTVRGLRIARTTATVVAAERAERCAQAADDLGVLTRFERHSEPYLYTL
ncbi:MAG TPA: hypothetical protein VFP84_17005 [Kofleriaceae bacterium]|nr:hypothetical protein [Kofleriaceae bacterium]